MYKPIKLPSQSGSLNLITQHPGAVGISFGMDKVPFAGINLVFMHKDAPELAMLYRAVGLALDHLQPGIASPLPEDDPETVEAMKVSHEADRLWREANV